MRFRSKKNIVTLEDGIVIKQHVDPAALSREAFALEQLHRAGLAVPALLGKGEGILKLEYISGPTYADLVDALTLEQARALAVWLADYHRITGSLRGDCNLRNFLWSKDTCFGVDFEDKPIRGEWEADLGQILAYTLTYDPPFTPAKAFSGRLLLEAFRQTGLELSLAEIRKAYLEAIAAMNSRRKNFSVHPHSAASFFDELG